MEILTVDGSLEDERVIDTLSTTPDLEYLEDENHHKKSAFHAEITIYAPSPIHWLRSTQ